jgi:predicted Fe-Mo cluster-binding NifX family protein
LSTRIACTPVTDDGRIGPQWGKADRVAVVRVDDGVIEEWSTFEVDWRSLHESGTEGSHHARVVRFLRDHAVTDVVAHHMGDGMRHTIDRLGVAVHLGAGGDARQAIVAAVAPEPTGTE